MKTMKKITRKTMRPPGRGRAEVVEDELDEDEVAGRGKGRGRSRSRVAEVATSRAPVLHGEAMTLPAAADHPVHSSTTDLRPAGTSVEADLFGVAPDAAEHMRRRVCCQAKHAAQPRSTD